MNLTDTQITFLCVVISVRNGSIDKEMPEKWRTSKTEFKKARAEKKKKRTSTQNFFRAVI